MNATVEAVQAAAADIGDTGLYVAYAALLIMAVVPIWIGSHLSLAPKSEVSKTALVPTILRSVLEQLGMHLASSLGLYWCPHAFAHRMAAISTNRRSRPRVLPAKTRPCSPSSRQPFCLASTWSSRYSARYGEQSMLHTEFRIETACSVPCVNVHWS